jgi:hypothetical protein
MGCMRQSCSKGRAGYPILLAMSRLRCGPELLHYQGTMASLLSGRPMTHPHGVLNEGIPVSSSAAVMEGSKSTGQSGGTVMPPLSEALVFWL